ncbi:hypothetical protein PIB30_078335 [Stylosanthes scabra]|uniref:Pentatricopeptide repeat-containing protein n=1 Tax=Stylosanthes scabra TaxID=79078 RepID=A0ABU6UUJ6_9FABA|nr:hypothetical protein [Stylosanthes scabra]
MTLRTVSTWNTMISGYSQWGCYAEALALASLMHRSCVNLDECFGIGEAKVVFEDLRGGNDVLWSVMLAGYVQRDIMGDALDMFEKMPDRDVVAWTTLISGYAKREDGCERALDLFWCMRSSGVLPNEVVAETWIIVIPRTDWMRHNQVPLKLGLFRQNFINNKILRKGRRGDNSLTNSNLLRQNFYHSITLQIFLPNNPLTTNIEY